MKTKDYIRNILTLLLCAFLLILALRINKTSLFYNYGGTSLFLPVILFLQLFIYTLKRKHKFLLYSSILSIFLSVGSCLLFSSSNLLILNLLAFLARFILIELFFNFLFNSFNLKNFVNYFFNKKETYYSLIIVAILTVFEIIGIYCVELLNITSISYLITFFLVYFFFVFMILKNYDSLNISGKGFKKSSFFIFWIIIFLSYVVALLYYFPGILSGDSIDQIYRAFNIYPLSNHHPVLHTLIIKMFLSVSSNYNIGVCLYSIFQSMCLSFCLAYSLKFMNDLKINKYIIITCFFIYLFSPINYAYSVTMWKDIPFAITTLFLIINLIKLSIDNNYLKKPWFNFGLSINILLFCLFRNNGIYIILLILPFILIYYKKNLRKLEFIIILPIILYYLITGPIYSYFKIVPGSTREALSVPLQQFARISIYENLTKDEINDINNFLDYQVIKEVYNPLISDPVKSTFKDAYFKDHKKEFITLWIKLFFKYPTSYFKSFFYNSYVYYYPETNFGITFEELANNELNIHNTRLIDYKISSEGVIRRLRKIPGISLLFSIGIYFWINMISFVISLIKKNYKLGIINLLFIALWLTVVASPVYAEFRYIYSIYICLPLIIVITFYKVKK